MKIKSIEINNILSIGKARLDVKEMGLTLIDGWNFDDDCANGAGKTSVFNAMSFCLYNKVPRKITASEILRKGTKKGYVKTIVERAGDVWEIVRGRPKLFSVKKNGVELDVTQEELEEKIGLSYLQFLISMYSAQTDSSKLINLNDTQKKDFFLQLLNLNAFSAVKKEADLNIKSLRFEMLELEKELVGLTATMRANKVMITDLSPIKVEIDTFNEDGLNKKFNDLRSIKSPDMSKYAEIESKISQKHRDLESVSLKDRQLRDELKNIEEYLTRTELEEVVLPNKVDCPHCNSSFGLSHGSEVTIEDLKKNQEQLLSTIRDKKQEIVNKINNAPNFKDGYEKLNLIVESIKIKKTKEYDDYNRARDGIEEVREKLSVLSNKKDILRMGVLRNDDLESRIVQSKTRIKSIKDEHTDKKKDLQVYEEVSQMASPTGAPAYIMDSIIESFNEKMSGFVNMIWPRAIYSLQAYKENKSGEIKAKFSENLVINGESRSIGGLSGGEQKCLSLAMDFAVIDILQSVFGTQLNPIVMDEPFNGLDSSNKERVIELLEKLSVDRNIMVIDHASEAKTMFSDIIRIEKRNDISEIV